MMMDEMGVLGGLIGACVGRWIRIHAMPHTFLPTTNPPFPCASFPSPLSPSIPIFILHFHSFTHSFHIADWRERGNHFFFTPNQTRFVPISHFPFPLFHHFHATISSFPTSLPSFLFFPHSFLLSPFPQMASSAPCDHSGQQPIEIGCAHTICANCGIANEPDNTIGCNQCTFTVPRPANGFAGLPPNRRMIHAMHADKAAKGEALA